MAPMRFDALALTAAALAVASAGIYIAVMRQQEARPLWWVLAVLALGAAAAGVAVDRQRDSGVRFRLLLAAALLQGAIGVLAILTIGLVILVAAAAAFAAAVRVDLGRGPALHQANNHSSRQIHPEE